MFEGFHLSRDEVLGSAFVSGVTDYKFALEAIYPLLDRFKQQRKAQNKKFYDRLRADIVKGCVMPPITLAFVSKKLAKSTKLDDLTDFVNENIGRGYILDGMQRLITLNDASQLAGFEEDRHIYINVIVAERYDLLLYRMITLNNGQKPMTARHQIEMLTSGAVDLSNVNFKVVSEKQTENKRIPNAFRLSDISEAYTAYLANSLHNQNSKIIESKLDEILVSRVMESDVTQESYSFSSILSQVGRFQENETNRNWLRQLNNLIGFTHGAKTSLKELEKVDVDKFAEQLAVFETAFDAINPSKVNVGKFRRELSSLFISKIDKLIEAQISELEEIFFEATMTE